MSKFDETIKEIIRVKSESMSIQDANKYYLNHGYATVVNDGLAWANSLER